MPGETVLEVAARDCARETVRAGARLEAKPRRELRSLVLEMPSRVRERGLARALVELAAQGASGGVIHAGAAAGLLLRDLLRWLGHRQGAEAVSPADLLPPEPNDPLHPVGSLIAADPVVVACVEEHAQTFLAWLKRLVEMGLLETERPQGGEEVGRA